MRGRSDQGQYAQSASDFREMLHASRQTGGGGSAGMAGRGERGSSVGDGCAGYNNMLGVSPMSSGSSIRDMMEASNAMRGSGTMSWHVMSQKVTQDCQPKVLQESDSSCYPLVLPLVLATPKSSKSLTRPTTH